MIDRKNRTTKRELTAQQTKEKLYAASIELVAKYGYDTVTIEEITSHVGFSKGAFYTHFQSKDAVFMEMFWHIDRKYTETFKTLPDDMTAAERLLLLIDTMSHYCEKTCGPDVMRIVYTNQISKTPHENHLTDRTRVFFKIIQEIVELGIKNNEFTGEFGEEELVQYLAGSARSVIFDWCLCGAGFSLIDYSRKRFELILRFIAKR